MLNQLSKPLFIAEKPDMGAKIAKQLPGPHKRGDGFIETGHGTVTWAVGHLLEQAQPQDYDAKYEKWAMADLPILPQQWKVQPIGGKSKQISTIRTLLKTHSDVINAGDPGREGQLIVDEILEFLNNKKPVWRLLLNALDPTSVQKAFAAIQTNQVFAPLYEAALGRQRADWVIGMNLTRAYTLVGRQQGYQGVLSVGRVQTPTLAIVVRREEEIEKFVPQKYWALAVQVGGQPPFWARYAPPKQYGEPPAEEDDDPNAPAPAAASAPAVQPRPAWLDDKWRVCTLQQAQAIVASVPKGTPATVTHYAKTAASEQPPLPFELSNIQSRMNAQYGASVQDVLDVCQKLYEEQYLTYPRTDSTYLKESQHGEAPAILAAIAAKSPDLAALANGATPALKSPAWNDAKVGEHHAIIPTAVVPDLSALSPLERHVYEAAAKRYIAQFYPPCQVDKVVVELDAGGHRWVARGRTITDPGWRVVYGAEPVEDEEKEGKDEDGESGALPPLTVGQSHPVVAATAEEKTTRPPPRYTQGTLLQVMQHVDRLVSDPAEKKVLKTVKGIGRSATRQNIIATLIKRGFMEEQKKKLIPTSAARVLVNAIDKNLTDPGLTARWEQALDGVATGKIPLATFQQKQEQWIHQLIQVASTAQLPAITGGPAPKGGAGGGGFGGKGGSGGKFAGKGSGSGAKSSKASGGGAGAAAAPGNPGPCPKCGKPMAQRTVKQGPKAGQTFWGCTGFPACSHSIWPK